MMINNDMTLKLLASVILSPPYAFIPLFGKEGLGEIF